MADPSVAPAPAAPQPGTGGDPAQDRLAALVGPWIDVLSTARTAICVTGAGAPQALDETIVFVNAAFETLTGFAAADVLGRSYRLLLAQDADPAAILRFNGAVAGTGTAQTDIPHRRRNGAGFWTRLGVATMHDAEGSPTFRVVTLASVTGEHTSAPEGREPHDGKLSNAQERLRLVQLAAGAASAAGAWEWDIPTSRLIVDARFASICGLDPAAAATDLPASAFFQSIHDEDRIRMRIAVAGALQGAEVFARDYRVVVDGEVRWVSARGRTYLDAEEKPLRFAGLLNDITTQRKIEERLFIAQTAGGVGSFEYLSGYGTADVSHEFCRLLGLRPAQTLPVRTINAVVHPDDPAIIQNRDGRILSGPAFHERRIIRADNGEERWLASRGEYRRASSGGVLFVGVIYDITAIKRSEAQLRRLTETLEERVAARTQERDRIWNLSPDLLNVIGPDGRQKAVNPAWTTLLGHDQATLVGTSMEELVHPDELGALRKHLSALQREEVALDSDIRLRAQDGSYRWVSWNAVLEDGNFYGVGRDVTQRKLLEDQLRQSQKMEAVGQLTGGLAHDFNNMLTAILGGIAMARRRIRQGRIDDVDRFIDAALLSGQRAAALTHRLLAFSRRQSLDSRPLDVGSLLRSMEDLLRRTLGERIHLVINVDPLLWSAVADENQLESAILNLAINSRDAMPRGGCLTIRGSNVTLSAADLGPGSRAEPGEFVEIRVTDDGIGMPPKVLAQAFDPFYTTKPLGEGTGLGLSMIYGFIQQSRGTIVMESEEGKGTSVRLFLPRNAGAQPNIARPDVDTIARGRGESILLIDDDPAVRLLVLQILQELGYQPIETADSSQAIPILQSSRRIDLLVSDVILPGLNGRQIADIARTTRPDLPVLFMTGYAKEAADQGQFLAEGMQIIKKPFSIEELGQMVNLILNRKNQLRDP